MCELNHWHDTVHPSIKQYQKKGLNISRTRHKMKITPHWKSQAVLSSTHFVLIILMDASLRLLLSPLFRGSRLLPILSISLFSFVHLSAWDSSALCLATVCCVPSLYSDKPTHSDTDLFYISLSLSRPWNIQLDVFQRPHTKAIYLFRSPTRRVCDAKDVKIMFSLAPFVKQIIKWKFDFVRDKSQRNLALDSKENKYFAGIAGIGC